MEQLFLLVQQVYTILDILSSYSQEEREELLEGYYQFLFEIKDIVITLNRIVEGSTHWGWKIEWGSLPWQLKTYRQQRGLTLQAGWEDRVDFGLDLYRDFPIESLRFLVPIGPPETLIPEDLDIPEVRSEVKTDICQIGYVQHERPVAYQEVILNDTSSSSGTEDPDETQELPVVEGSSDLDSMPELEDEVDLSTIEIPLWLIPQGVLITLRGGRVTFEREQGPPWQEVLAQMLKEQELTTEDS